MSYNISYSDVMRHKKAGEDTLENKFKLRDILQEMGMDLNKGYEVLYCHHKSTITGKRFTGKLFQGRERTDLDWKVIKYMVNSLELYNNVEGNILDGYSEEFEKKLREFQKEYYDSLEGGINA